MTLPKIFKSFESHSVLREPPTWQNCSKYIRLWELSGMHNFEQIHNDFSFELTFIELQVYKIYFMFRSSLKLVVTLAHFYAFQITLRQ